MKMKKILIGVGVGGYRCRRRRRFLRLITSSPQVVNVSELGRASDRAERVSEGAGRASDRAGRVSEGTGRPAEGARMSSEKAKRALGEGKQMW